MQIAIIGAHGKVGHTLVEHFTFLGHEVIEVDQDADRSIKQASRMADVVFIAILPLCDVSKVISEVAQNIGENRLIIHGSSVQQVDRCDESMMKILIDKNISLCHCHFHFLPELPLRKTLLGQHITTCFSGSNNGSWEQWLKDQFVQFDPSWHRLSENQHDEVTAISQLMHMSLAFIIGHIWARDDKGLVQQAITIGGPPLQFLVRSILRTSRGATVAAEILSENPHTLRVIKMFREALDVLESHVRHRDIAELKKMGELSRTLVAPDVLSVFDESTAALLRFEADRGDANIVTFHFSSEDNRDNLLVDVLHEFGRRGVDLTTTFAQEDPDSGCTFLIGVRDRNDAVQDAIDTVNAW